MMENWKKLDYFQWLIKRGFGTGCSDDVPKKYPQKSIIRKILKTKTMLSNDFKRNTLNKFFIH